LFFYTNVLFGKEKVIKLKDNDKNTKELGEFFIEKDKSFYVSLKRNKRYSKN